VAGEVDVRWVLIVAVGGKRDASMGRCRVV
jgi:hypothetical protein